VATARPNPVWRLRCDQQHCAATAGARPTTRLAFLVHRVEGHNDAPVLTAPRGVRRRPLTRRAAAGRPCARDGLKISSRRDMAGRAAEGPATRTVVRPGELRSCLCSHPRAVALKPRARAGKRIRRRKETSSARSGQRSGEKTTSDSSGAAFQEPLYAMRCSRTAGDLARPEFDPLIAAQAQVAHRRSPCVFL
jgi:hypothetical protein